MTRVGIPRALAYYQYYPMWKAFFGYLGVEVVVSNPTNKEVVASGSARTVAETCLPTKVFCGQALSLVGKCDYLFVPAIRSLQKDSYNCAKFLGLPDLVRAVVPESPPILDTDIDIPEGKRELYLNIYRLGRHFTRNPLKVKKAAAVALDAHRSYLNLMCTEKLTAPQAIEEIEGKLNGRKETSSNLKVALIGYPYVLYDEYINHRLISRLEAMGVKFLTPEMVPKEELEHYVNKLVGRHYWTYEDKVSGAGGYYIEHGIDGVIGVMSFGCGPDSLMMDVVKRYAKKAANTPFLILSIDEHTAEAGIITRLEAFIDMIRRGKRNKG